VVLRNLQRQGFASPTPIQAMALPPAIVKRADVVRTMMMMMMMVVVVVVVVVVAAAAAVIYR
jgi:heme/copper-type cytochrome/quinol oxidase subunit 2